MLKNKFSFAVALATLAVPFVVFAQSVSTTPVVPSTSTSGLIVSVTSPSAPINGGTNVNLATIRLDATGLMPITVSSLPVTTVYSGGVTADDLSNCRVFNNSNGTTLTTGRNVYTALFNGANLITFDAPTTVSTGTPTFLSLTCDVTARAGSGLQMTVAPTAFPPNSVMTSNGTSITPMTGTTASGTMAPITGSVVFTGVGSTPIPTTPGIPNTGFGTSMMAVYALIASLAIVATGGFFLRRNLATK